MEKKGVNIGNKKWNSIKGKTKEKAYLSGAVQGDPQEALEVMEHSWTVCKVMPAWVLERQSPKDYVSWGTHGVIEHFPSIAAGAD